MARYLLSVDGAHTAVEAWDPDMPLLYALCNGLGWHAAKFGCGLGQRGTCTELVDNLPARSRLLKMSDAVGRRITTAEGLGTPDRPHPVQAAFVAEQAAQCGWLLHQRHGDVRGRLVDPHAQPPTREQAQGALAGNLCRCGSHDRVLKPVVRASGQGRA